MQTFEYRLYPTQYQRTVFMACLIETRNLYNEMLEATKANYVATGKFLFRYDLNRMFKGRRAHTPATTVQTLADRLDKALRRFLDRRKIDPKAGFPRFKTPNRWHSIQLRQWSNAHDVSLSDDRRYLVVPHILGRNIKIKLHRPLEGIPKTARLILRADGHWYAQIVCDVPKPEGQKQGRLSVGIDVGLKSFLTDSTGETVGNPRYYRKAQATLRRKQRTLCRRRKGSIRRRKAARSVAQTHLKIERQRRDFHHKVARDYADLYGFIAVEKLNIVGMVRGNLAKSILDAGWNQFIAILTDKAERAGGQVIAVNPAYTTQECFKCGELVQKSLSVRTHVCPHCGYVADRDVNAAKNILKKAKAGARPSDANVAGCGERCLRSP